MHLFFKSEIVITHYITFENTIGSAQDNYHFSLSTDDNIPYAYVMRMYLDYYVKLNGFRYKFYLKTDSTNAV